MIEPGISSVIDLIRREHRAKFALAAGVYRLGLDAVQGPRTRSHFTHGVSMTMTCLGFGACVKILRQLHAIVSLVERGLATEACRTALAWAFGRHAWSECVAVVRPANQAAIRVCSKLGMRYESALHVSGVPTHVYQLERAAWVVK